MRNENNVQARHKAFKAVTLKEKKKPNFWLTLLPLPAFLFLWYANQDKNGIPLWVAMCSGLGLGLFSVYGSPWIYYICPTHVGLYPKGLATNDKSHSIEYKKMKEFSISNAGGISILSMTGVDDTEHLIGMPIEVDQSSLENYLTSKGITLKSEQ